MKDGGRKRVVAWEINVEEVGAGRPIVRTKVINHHLLFLIMLGRS